MLPSKNSVNQSQSLEKSLTTLIQASNSSDKDKSEDRYFAKYSCWRLRGYSSN